MRQSAARDKMTIVAEHNNILMTGTVIGNTYDFRKISQRIEQMIHYERTLEINATPEAIWGVLSRFMQIDEIAPQIAYVEALTHGANGIGSKRRCYFENGTSLVEEVTEWDPNRGYSVRLSDMTAMPLTDAHATIAIKPLDGASTRVIWSMDYAVKYGPLGWFLGQTLMKMMMSKVLDSNLKALANKVNSDHIPDAEPAYY